VPRPIRTKATVALASGACALLWLPLRSVIGRADGRSAEAITTLQDAVGERLRAWWSEGSAAGNAGDVYDNRDRGHSRLDLALFPQLRAWEYSETERGRKLDWAGFAGVRPAVTLGNSSTAAPVAAGGSIPRRLYSNAKALKILDLQYRRHNLYVYPEHLDHDPGRNGDGGYGDLFPTNTPYLLVSQGSSGSDQPFLRALAATLAAFRPEVKRKLVDAQLLMPAVQLILRASYRGAPRREDYLTGKAHPSVFAGELLDPARMIELAHQMREDSVPPLAQLMAVREDPLPLDAGSSEVLADAPACIARVFRASPEARRIVVTAEVSFDANQRPLTYHWAVLRGDPARVAIKPVTPNSSTVEIQVRHHERRSIEGGSPLESNRVDIGAFVHNGVHYSAPAFVTFFTFDSEARTYDDGRPVDIGYGAGASAVSVSDWPALLSALEAKPLAPGPALLLARLGHKRLEAVLKNDAARLMLALRSDKKTAVPDAARAALAETFREVLADVDFCRQNAEPLAQALAAAPPETAASFLATRSLATALGLLDGAVEDAFAFRFLRGEARPTRFERMLVARLNAAALALLLPGALHDTFTPNYVDPALAPAPPGRDVFRYGAAGAPLGWTRYRDGRVQQFDAAGNAVVDPSAFPR
jgi:hypothetical protein